MSKRHRSTRRTVLHTLGTLGALGIATSTAAAAPETDARTAGDDQQPNAGPAAVADGCDWDDATLYVAVVDRIVDGEHVVMLLEKDCELVDQHVEPRSSFDDVAESDILVAVVGDDELLYAQRVPERPGCL